MKNKTTTQGQNKTTLAVIGASLVGLVGTAYFFLGPKGKNHQKHTKAWAIRMKADVIEKLEKTGKVTESVYNEIINSVATKYEKVRNVDIKEVEEIVNDLKKHWKVINKDVIKKQKQGKISKKVTSK